MGWGGRQGALYSALWPDLHFLCRHSVAVVMFRWREWRSAGHSRPWHAHAESHWALYVTGGVIVVTVSPMAELKLRQHADAEAEMKDEDGWMSSTFNGHEFKLAQELGARKPGDAAESMGANATMTPANNMGEHAHTEDLGLPWGDPAASEQ